MADILEKEIVGSLKESGLWADQIGSEWNMSLRPGARSTCMLGCSDCSAFTNLRWASRSSLALGEGVGKEPVYRSDYGKPAIIFQPVNSQFAQVNFPLQLKLWGIVLCQYS